MRLSGWWLVASGKLEQGLETKKGTGPGDRSECGDSAVQVVEFASRFGLSSLKFWNAQYRTPNVLPSWKTSPRVGSDGGLPYHTSDRPNAPALATTSLRCRIEPQELS